jgi:hypothetical protein
MIQKKNLKDLSDTNAKLKRPTYAFGLKFIIFFKKINFLNA